MPPKNTNQVFDTKGGSKLGIESVLISFMTQPWVLEGLMDSRVRSVGLNITAHKQFGHIFCLTLSAQPNTELTDL
jgi:hypothetical protein